MPFEGLPVQARKSRIVVDFVAVYPVDLRPEQLAAIVRDYMHLMRFCEVPAQISLYPVNTRIVQQAISLASNLNDIKS